MVAAEAFCHGTGDLALLLVGLGGVEGGLVLLLSLLSFFLLFAVSQRPLAQEVGIRTQALLLLSMDLSTIPLVHPPALSAFFSLN